MKNRFFTKIYQYSREKIEAVIAHILIRSKKKKSTLSQIKDTVENSEPDQLNKKNKSVLKDGLNEVERESPENIPVQNINCEGDDIQEAFSEWSDVSTVNEKNGENSENQLHGEGNQAVNSVEDHEKIVDSQQEKDLTIEESESLNHDLFKTDEGSLNQIKDEELTETTDNTSNSEYINSDVDAYTSLSDTSKNAVKGNEPLKPGKENKTSADQRLEETEKEKSDVFSVVVEIREKTLSKAEKRKEYIDTVTLLETAVDERYLKYAEPVPENNPYAVLRNRIVRDFLNVTLIGEIEISDEEFNLLIPAFKNWYKRAESRYVVNTDIDCAW